jgi:hypothetical protein
VADAFTAASTCERSTASYAADSDVPLLPPVNATTPTKRLRIRDRP